MDINMVKNQVDGVLDKYDKMYTPRGVMANLDEWSNNKGALVDLLRKHPKWNEEALAVIFDLTEDRGIDRDVVYCRAGDLLELRHDVDLECRDFVTVGSAIRYACSVYAKTITCADIVSEIIELIGVNCAVGQKTSRVINAICKKYGIDKHPRYNAVFAQLADALNPLQIKRKALLSVHPCDFLEMSSNRNSWRSCHRLDGGEYQAGTLSYMNDSCSMVFYTVDDEVMTDFYKVAKRTRQVFCYQDGILLQSRLYPNTDDEVARDLYRGLVQGTIAECCALPNLWNLQKSQNAVDHRVGTDEDANHYPDYDHECYSANISVLKEYSVAEDDYITVGSTAYCIDCADQLHWSEELRCEACSGQSVCYECGDLHDLDDLHEIDGEYYCDNCCSFCEECDEYTFDEMTSVVNYRGRWISVCESCLETFSFCEECGEYYSEDRGAVLNDGFHCQSCLSEYYHVCAGCGNYARSDNTIVIDDEYYCTSCAEDIKSDIEEND